MELLKKFFIEIFGTGGGRAVSDCLWDQAILLLLLQSHLPASHCQQVCSAELQCQYLPRWFYQALSSGYQRLAPHQLESLLPQNDLSVDSESCLCKQRLTSSSSVQLQSWYTSE